MSVKSGDSDIFYFLNAPASEVAPQLLGCNLERIVDGTRLQARIVEVEAYDQTDAASHSYKGRTARTDIMFGESGTLYVYFTYGLHYCCNVVVGTVGYGAAVLIRAVEPLEGLSTMSSNRHQLTGKNLTNGPAKLCQALAIDKRLNGHDLHRLPLRLNIEPPLPSSQIVQTTRIGISQAKSTTWRFYIRGNAFVSKL
jgi:DNA-3-methyladenine glycosylase